MSKIHRIKVNEHALTRVIDALIKDSKVIGHPVVLLEGNDIIVQYNYNNYREHSTLDKNGMIIPEKPRNVLLEGNSFPTPPGHLRHNDYPNVGRDKKLPPRDDELDAIDG